MAMVLDAALSRVVKFLIQLAIDEVAVLWNLSGDIKELQATAEAIQLVLADAEMSSTSSKTVEAWLSDLTDLLYDADDILDLCKAKFDQQRAGRSGGLMKGHKIGKRIKKLNGELDAINKRWSKLTQLLPAASTRGAPDFQSPTPLGIIAIGEKIKEDTDNILEKLIAGNGQLEQQGTGDPWVVIAIVGAPGIGKTALARNLYSHPSIKKEFQDENCWVNLRRVADEHTKVTLLHSAITQFGGNAGYFGKRQSKAVLHPILEKAVSGKKIFMVIDNMWSTNDWEDLLVAPLRSCACGSRIIVTTRNMDVARRMNAAFTHRVTELNVEDGWALLKDPASRADRVEEIEELKQIGEQIVLQCQGLPLAIYELGRGLCNSPGSQWQRVLDEISTWSRSGLPKNTNDAIFSSYDDMPSHLKQCFLYCSLIPKGRHINRTIMSQYWVAEGFILPPANSNDLEIIGENYFRELVARNLLCPISSSLDESNCQMHDVIRSFAQYLIRKESILEGCSPNENDHLKSVRRLILSGDTSLGQLQKEMPVRTLLTYDCPKVELRKLTTSMSSLRIVELMNSTLDSIHDSLYCLKHLRYLGVRETDIDFISPKISNLGFLQYLHLENCKKLRKIPSTIVELVELRGLFLEGSNVQDIPAGLKNLRNMVLWTGFTPM